MDKSPDAFRTISEVAEDLDLPQHVLRFWETRFAQIRPLKRGGGRRYYRPVDVDLLRGIKYLLYGKGYTLRGVQKILKEEGVRVVQEIWREDEPRRFAAGPGGARPTRPLVESAEPDSDETDTPRSAGDDPFQEDESEDDFADEAELEPAERDDAPSPPAPAPRPAAGLQPDALRQLQAALAELSECRGLIARVRGAADSDLP